MIEVISGIVIESCEVSEIDDSKMVYRIADKTGKIIFLVDTYEEALDKCKSLEEAGNSDPLTFDCFPVYLKDVHLNELMFTGYGRWCVKEWSSGKVLFIADTGEEANKWLSEAEAEFKGEKGNFLYVDIFLKGDEGG